MDIAESHSAKPAGFTGGLCRLNGALANRYSGSTRVDSVAPMPQERQPGLVVNHFGSETEVLGS